MATLFGGATAVEGFGGWRDDDRDQAVILEDVSIIVSLMAEEEWNEKNVRDLRAFLHKMGRETDQGEMGVVVNGKYLPIRRFDGD